MTNTIVSSHSKEITIGFDAPFCVIGERINPTGRKLLAAEMAEGNYEQAAVEFLDALWAAQVGNRADEVAEMIRTGRYPE